MPVKFHHHACEIPPPYRGLISRWHWQPDDRGSDKRGIPAWTSSDKLKRNCAFYRIREWLNFMKICQHSTACLTHYSQPVSAFGTSDLEVKNHFTTCRIFIDKTTYIYTVLYKNNLYTRYIGCVDQYIYITQWLLMICNTTGTLEMFWSPR